ncbi:MAG: ATP-binding protein [Candidatus Thermoplasmatota archaeon]|nr:ATP-binding protein [Candidatus Thermoplasmatota archaeon]
MASQGSVQPPEGTSGPTLAPYRMLGTVVVAAILLIQGPTHAPPWATYGFLATILGYAGLTLWATTRRTLFPLPWMIPTMDTSFLLGLLALTGGALSPFFPVTFVLVVGFALSHRTGVTVAATGALVVGHPLVALALGQMPAQLANVATDVTFLALAGLLATLLSRRAREERESRLEMDHLVAATRQLTKSIEREQALAEIVEAGLALTGSDRGAIFTRDPNEGDLLIPYAVGLPDTFVERVTQQYRNMSGAEFWGESAYVHVEDIREHRLFADGRGDKLARMGIRSLAIFPLMLDEETVGALALYKDTVGGFTEEQLQLVATLAGYAAVVLGNLELVDAIRAGEARYRELYQHAPLAYFSLGPDGSIRDANARASELFGLPVTSLAGRPMLDLCAPSQQGIQRVETLFERAREGEAIQGEEVELERADGRRFWVNLTMHPAMDPNQEVTGWRAMAEDITARRQAEGALAKYAADLERSNRELQQFAYVASHDLQEPLRMVASYVQLLERRQADALDEDTRVFMEYIVEGVHRMRALIQDLLAFSEVDYTSGPVAPVALSEVVEDVLAHLAPEIEATGARIEVHELPTVPGHRDQLADLFHHLLGNALKFQPEGATPEVTIEARVEGPNCRIDVHDNGIGIAPQHQQRIFTIFQRLHARDLYPGTGVGLALCRKIVERHGGRIGVESDLGQGTTFSFTLPTQLPHAHPASDGAETGHGSPAGSQARDGLRSAG